MHYLPCNGILVSYTKTPKKVIVSNLIEDIGAKGKYDGVCVVTPVHVSITQGLSTIESANKG
jgi:hypothetical protein